MLVALGHQGQLSLPVPCCAAGGGAVKGGGQDSEDWLLPDGQ